MEPFPSIDNAEEIRKYRLNYPTSAIEVDEITRELAHWRTLCNERLFEEVRTGDRGNPISIANLYRLGGLIVALLSFPASFAGPLVGLPLAGAGLSLCIYGEIDASRKKRRREPVRLALERCEELEQELENRSRSR